MNWERVYRTLLRLYPYDYRARFAAEMLNAFEQAFGECRRQAALTLVCFFVRELIHLLFGAGSEWIAKLSTDNSVRGRCLPDLRMMRPPGVSRELWFAGTCVNIRESCLPDEVTKAQERMEALINRIVHAIANHDFPAARRYSCEERDARDELCRLKEKYDLADPPE